MAVPGSVRLREVLAEDLPIHDEQQRDPESAAMAAVAARDPEAFAAHWAQIQADPTAVVRSVVCDGEVVGSAMSFVRDGERQVGYRIAREHWGRGIASAALLLLLEEVDERPLHARVAVHNAASLRVLEKAGFRRLGQEDGGDVTLWVLRLG